MVLVFGVMLLVLIQQINVLVNVQVSQTKIVYDIIYEFLFFFFFNIFFTFFSHSAGKFSDKTGLISDDQCTGKCPGKSKNFFGEWNMLFIDTN